MPIQLPNLDTKTYKNFSDEMIASIPKYTDKWTDHNPSDPGITIIEMLAWIAETTLYRINRLPDESYVNLLRLVTGASGTDEVVRLLKNPQQDESYRKILEFLKEIEEGHEKTVAEIKTEALFFLTSRYRAVTEDDFCRLVIESTESFKMKIKRAIIEQTPDEGKVRIIIVPDKWEKYEKHNEAEKREGYKELVKLVGDYLKPRMLIGTKIEVKQPAYTNVSIDLKVICHHHATVEKTEKLLHDNISQYLDPLIGGNEKTGWPYRRPLTVYEIARIVGETDGVKQAESIIINGTKELKIKPIAGLIKVDLLNIEVLKGEK